ncbi:MULTISPECIES: hypothetical protein [Vagococcus]|uniref:Uncharacterized protein n=1 Tax=Vagococcus fluvialis bH819 TaxID=1255619 RepID=A0A1X6WPZ8_9ENTE|nr:MULTISPECIES: hypothetical protein [Vagococcus]SLM86359.1 hypothetical protein FM121_09730 [Vagococcus fluvialis bH819]
MLNRKEVDSVLNLASLEKLEYLADYTSNIYYEETKEVNQYLYVSFYKNNEYYNVK